MKNLSNTIYDTYVSAFQRLSPPTQLHFSSRLSQWDNDQLATRLLSDLVAQAQPASKLDLEQQLHQLLRLSATDQPGINAPGTRAHYFAKYPQLYGLHAALFQVRNWLFHYSIDARDILRTMIDSPDYHLLLDKIMLDVPALGALSTYAVNTIYLAKRLLDNDEAVIFDGQAIKNIMAAAKPAPDCDMLLLYFATHCVIADTLFYARPVPPSGLAHYRLLLTTTETAIANRLASLTLDAQFELLVAHALCGTDSAQQAAILERGRANFDLQLGFITDSLRPKKNSLSTAEHRNVLFIMASRPCQLTS